MITFHRYWLAASIPVRSSFLCCFFFFKKKMPTHATVHFEKCERVRERKQRKIPDKQNINSKKKAQKAIMTRSILKCFCNCIFLFPLSITIFIFKKKKIEKEKVVNCLQKSSGFSISGQITYSYCNDFEKLLIKLIIKMIKVLRYDRFECLLTSRNAS